MTKFFLSTLLLGAVVTAIPVHADGVGAGNYVRSVVVDQKHPNASDNGPGNADQPYRTISRAMLSLQPGDDVQIYPGVYRESIIVPAISDAVTVSTRIRAAVNKTVEETVVRGSTAVANWEKVSDNRWSVLWDGEEPSQVFRNGKPLQQIGGTIERGFPLAPDHPLNNLHVSEGGIWPGRINGGVGNLRADSFAFDAVNKRIVIQLSTPLGMGEALEVSSRRHVLQAEHAHNLVVDGLIFDQSNTSVTYLKGGVKVVGAHNTLSNLVVQNMDAFCVELIGDDNVLSDTFVHNCGQIGVNARGQRVSILRNWLVENNYRGFNKWWAAGAMKLIGEGGIHNSTIRHNAFVYNNGDGLWIDWKNSGITIDSNLAAYNAGFGIHYEASSNATITKNWTYGNDRGINLTESSDSLISGNTVFGNKLEGIAVVDGIRSATDPTLKPFNNQIVGNTIAWNDEGRNWIQLTLPGANFHTVSDRNVFKAEGIPPRMSLGFMSSTNYPYERLEWWQRATHLDGNSSTETIPMPDALKKVLAVRKLIWPVVWPTNTLPSYLLSPGTH